MLLEEAMAGASDAVSFTPRLPPELRGGDVTKTPSDVTSLSNLRQRGYVAPEKETAPRQTRVFILKHAQALDVSTTIRELLEVSGSTFRMAADPRTNRVLVHGTPDKLDEVGELVQQLDQPDADPLTPRNNAKK
jgi:type II secretory pathway component GspD/PulD (secretin)